MAATIILFDYEHRFVETEDGRRLPITVLFGPYGTPVRYLNEACVVWAPPVWVAIAPYEKSKLQ